MAQLTAEQATQLANHFLGLAQAIGDFRYANWETLSQEENKKLATSQAAILKSGEDIFALSATLIMTDVQTSLLQIKSLTQQIKSTITHLKDIQKAINGSYFDRKSRCCDRNNQSARDREWYYRRCECMGCIVVNNQAGYKAVMMIAIHL